MVEDYFPPSSQLVVVVSGRVSLCSREPKGNFGAISLKPFFCIDSWSSSHPSWFLPAKRGNSLLGLPKQWVARCCKGQLAHPNISRTFFQIPSTSFHSYKATSERPMRRQKNITKHRTKGNNYPTLFSHNHGSGKIPKNVRKLLLEIHPFSTEPWL